MIVVEMGPTQGGWYFRSMISASSARDMEIVLSQKLPSSHNKPTCSQFSGFFKMASSPVIPRNSPMPPSEPHSTGRGS